MKLNILPMLLLALLAAACGSKNELIKPRALQPGDKILFVAPARSHSEEATNSARAYLEQQGYVVEFAPNIFEKYGYLAGSDEARAAGVMQGFNDPDVDAIFPVTGGYGCSRILELLDYDVIRKNPKVLIGYSDITALHLAIQKKSGLVTFHSPMPTYIYQDHNDIRQYAHEGFWQAIGANASPAPYVIDTDAVSSPVLTLVPGVARGRLTGGNLSLIAATMGTPYEMETKGRLLFIEDVGEEPYRMDRMLAQLELSGKLDECAGVILGMCRGCEAENPENSLTLDEVYDRYFATRDYPVVKQFPIGHVRENATMPMGVMAELDATNGRLTILERGVR